MLIFVVRSFLLFVRTLLTNQSELGYREMDGVAQRKCEPGRTEGSTMKMVWYPSYAASANSSIFTFTPSDSNLRISR